jgi:hypothetical protein
MQNADLPTNVKIHLIVLAFLAQLCLMKLFYISDGSDPYKGQVAGLPGV